MGRLVLQGAKVIMDTPRDYATNGKAKAKMTVEAEQDGVIYRYSVRGHLHRKVTGRGEGP